VGTQTKTQGPSTTRDFSLRYKSRFARDDSMVWGINDRGGAGIGDGVGIDDGYQKTVISSEAARRVLGRAA